MANRKYPQTITRWTVTPDGYGTQTFGSPTTLAGRWEDKQDLFRDARGDEVMSKARVYVVSDVNIGDWLALGDQTATADPRDLANAHEVKQFIKVPDLRGKNFDRKAVL